MGRRDGDRSKVNARCRSLLNGLRGRMSCLKAGVLTALFALDILKVQRQRMARNAGQQPDKEADYGAEILYM